jgi:hypothetical protein
MSLTKKDLEDIVKSYKVDLAAINNKLDTLLTENAALKKLVSSKDEEIAALKVQLNGVEQHNRSWSVRVLGLPLTPAEEKSSVLIREKLFKNVLLPIFEGAAKEGDLREIPKNADSVLEMAHPLRSKEGTTKPIIARFYARELRVLVFRHKKAYAPKHTDGPTKDRYKFHIFEDLTALSFSKMRALAADPRVAASWSSYGQIRYRLADDPTIRKVGNILDSVDKILA